MIDWFKNNIFNIVNFGLLIFILIELERVKVIAIKTEAGTEMNNFKLDYVEADINKGQLDTTTCCDKK